MPAFDFKPVYNRKKHVSAQRAHWMFADLWKKTCKFLPQKKQFILKCNEQKNCHLHDSSADVFFRLLDFKFFLIQNRK